MTFEYCPQCGEKLYPKTCGDEGAVPYCRKCLRPFFSFSYPCAVCLCITEDGREIALIKQKHVSDSYINVAGFVKCGETPEETAVREVKEELGLDVLSCRYLNSCYSEKSDSLMLGFVCTVKKTELKPSCEIDEAEWFPIDTAEEKLCRDCVGSILFNCFMKTHDLRC